MSGFFRNSERYYDPTAGAALKTIEMGERMDYEIGDIVSVVRGGSPIEKKFLVLARNQYVLTGLELLTKELANCIPVVCGAQLYVDPYRLGYVSFNSNDVEFLRCANTEELNAVIKGVRDALGFKNTLLTQDAEDAAETAHAEESTETDSDLFRLAEEQAKELIEAKATAKIYRDLYEKLLQRCLKTA